MWIDPIGGLFPVRDPSDPMPPASRHGLLPRLSSASPATYSGAAGGPSVGRSSPPPPTRHHPCQFVTNGLQSNVLLSGGYTLGGSPASSLYQPSRGARKGSSLPPEVPPALSLSHELKLTSGWASSAPKAFLFKYEGQLCKLTENTNFRGDAS